MFPASSNLPILVLDDDAVLRDLLGGLLALHGYRPVMAASGEEALAALEASPSPFAAVLSDVQMPGLSGEELLHRIRLVAHPGTLLLGMSGSALPEALRALLDGFVQKPFSAEDLQFALTSAAKQQQARGDRPTAERGEQAPSPSEPSGVAANVATDGTSPVLNESIISSLQGMLPAEKLQELFALTLGDVRKRHRRMQDAAASGDLATVRREAHAVKGSCGMVGAAELQTLAAALEDGTTLNTSALAEIPRACERLERMLQSKLQSI